MFSYSLYHNWPALLQLCFTHASSSCVAVRFPPKESTALHLAVENGHSGLVEILLEKRIDEGVKDSEGKTAEERVRKGSEVEQVWERRKQKALMGVKKREEEEKGEQQIVAAATVSSSTPTQSATAPKTDSRSSSLLPSASSSFHQQPLAQQSVTLLSTQPHALHHQPNTNNHVRFQNDTSSFSARTHSLSGSRTSNSLNQTNGIQTVQTFPSNQPASSQSQLSPHTDALPYPSHLSNSSLEDPNPTAMSVLTASMRASSMGTAPTTPDQTSHLNTLQLSMILQQQAKQEQLLGIQAKALSQQQERIDQLMDERKNLKSELSFYMKKSNQFEKTAMGGPVSTATTGGAVAADGLLPGATGVMPGSPGGRSKVGSEDKSKVCIIL